MASIPAAICRVFCNNFKRYYVKNGRLFLDFLLKFWKACEIYKILKKKDESPSLIISEIIVSDRGVYWNV